MAMGWSVLRFLRGLPFQRITGLVRAWGCVDGDVEDGILIVV